MPRAEKARLEAGSSAELWLEGFPAWASLGQALEPGSGDGRTDRSFEKKYKR